MAQSTITSNNGSPLGLPNTGTGTDQGDTWDAAILKINTMFTELYSGTSSIAGAKTFSTAPTKFAAGTASAVTLSAAGNMSVNVTPSGSSATNTTQTLMSYSLAPNALDSAGRGLMIQAWGVFAGNAAPKTMQLNVGGMVLNSGSLTQSGSTWVFTAEVYKTAANAQTGLLLGQFGTVFALPKATTDTSVDTGTITISVQVLDASAALSNVICNALVVEYFQ